MHKNITWFSWRDIYHPQAGGAEKVQHELLTRLIKDGHSVQLITSGHKNQVNDLPYQVWGRGNRYTVYLWAAWYYFRHARHRTDFIVEEINTVPFFTKLYARKQRVLFIHQLAREIWFYQYFFPLNYVGYWLEPLYQRFVAGPPVVTVSESSKRDLQRCGHKNIQVISVGHTLAPVSKPNPNKCNNRNLQLLAFGAIRPMKRTLHAIKAFEHVHEALPQTTLVIAGDDTGEYAKEVRDYAASSKHASAIRFLGRVDAQAKATIMRDSVLLLSCAVKEGWGITITEAASQGTPAVAYDIDGQRDSADLIVPPNPTAMSEAVIALLNDPAAYAALQTKVLNKAKGVTFDASYKGFYKAIANINH